MSKLNACVSIYHAFLVTTRTWQDPYQEAIEKKEIREFHYEAGVEDMCPKKKKHCQTISLKTPQASSRCVQ